MCTENFIITKRDGTTERFSLDKIKSAILKAFTSLHQPIDAQGLQRIVEHLRFCNGMSVEDIQVGAGESKKKKANELYVKDRSTL